MSEEKTTNTEQDEIVSSRREMLDRREMRVAIIVALLAVVLLPTIPFELVVVWRSIVVGRRTTDSKTFWLARLALGIAILAIIIMIIWGVLQWMSTASFNSIKK